MYKRVATSFVAVALAVTTTAFAQTTIDVTGRVVRVDPGAQVVVLDGNQAFRVTPSTVLLVNNQPVTLGALQPGHVVVIRSAEAVAMAPLAPAPGSTVIVAPPAAAAAPAALPRQTIFGHVTDVSSGEIEIKTDADSFDVKVPREVAAQVRKGDTVRLDLTFQPSR